MVANVLLQNLQTAKTDYVVFKKEKNKIKKQNKTKQKTKKQNKKQNKKKTKTHLI